MQTLRGSPMKSYRCVFTYSGGNTSIAVTAPDGACALTEASSAIDAGDYDRVEVWDGDLLVMTRTTPRAWDALGALTSAEPAAMASSSLPRRPSSPSFAARLKSFGLQNAKTRWRRLIDRKGERSKG